ncbi:hypothetical protein GOODEAATRI_023298 [Goodea atripinnis]|uniref:Uncharacterized protein n=1 Tax=Goodea atripinnis TaxID=208336 RepID=A0ABV0Q141_9TELE
MFSLQASTRVRRYGPFLWTHRPQSLPPGGGGGVSSSHRKRRTLVAPEMNLSLDQSEGSLLSDDFLDTPDDLDINVDDIDTPDETDSLEFITNGNDLEWEDDTPVASAKAGPDGGSGATAEDGNANNGRLWRTVIIGEQEHRIDMQIIKPYLRVITHGGQCQLEKAALQMGQLHVSVAHTYGLTTSCIL